MKDDPYYIAILIFTVYSIAVKNYASFQLLAKAIASWMGMGATRGLHIPTASTFWGMWTTYSQTLASQVWLDVHLAYCWVDEQGVPYDRHMMLGILLLTILDIGQCEPPLANHTDVRRANLRFTYCIGFHLCQIIAETIINHHHQASWSLIYLYTNTINHPYRNIGNYRFYLSTIVRKMNLQYIQDMSLIIILDSW